MIRYRQLATQPSPEGHVLQDACGVDGSQAAERALESAIDLAKRYEAKLIILHVILQRLCAVTPTEAGVLTPTVFVSEMQAEGESIIKKAEQYASREGIDYECKMVQGIPAYEIIKSAHAEVVDLVILGSRSLNEVRAFLFGSVSDRVSHRVKCPTLIVK
jgi:nucleotide-binding universal stress UspA family protein